MSRRISGLVARRGFRRHRRALIIVVALAALSLARLWQTPHRPPEALSEGAYRVQRVVDGDTLLLDNRAYVRLVGVDAPEMARSGQHPEPFAPEASEFARRFVEQQDRIVRLRFDRERVDKYGRFLAYVSVGDRMLNEELVRAGLATAETGYRYAPAMKNRFQRAEEEAKAAGRGIWSRGAATSGSL
jgi:endonuclease YncB( thermonuclease family)